MFNSFMFFLVSIWQRIMEHNTLKHLEKTLGEENIAAHKAGKVNDIFQGMSPLLADETSPFHMSASAIGGKLVGTIPIESSENQSELSQQQSIADIGSLLMLATGKSGVVYSQTHLEDLSNISRLCGGLFLRDVEMYLRGVMRANQIAATTTMSALVNDLNIAIKAINTTSQTYTANTADINEKIASLAKRVDSIGPEVVRVVKAEHLTTRNRVESLRGASKAVMGGPLPASPVSVPAEPTGMLSIERNSSSAVISAPPPGIREVSEFLKLASCPNNMIDSVARTHVGKLSWEQYNAGMHGAISIDAVCKIILDWAEKK